jgi:hypothetical protein
MPILIKKATAVELNNEHNGYKVENVVQIIGLSITSGSKAEQARLRLRNEQLLIELGSSKSQEQALRETCLWQLSEIQTVNERLEEQQQLCYERQGRAHRAEMLLAALVSVFLVHLLSVRAGLLLAACWLALACMVYIPRLGNFAGGMKLPRNARLREVALAVLEYCDNGLRRLIDRLRFS